MRADINKFSIPQMTSNSNGKTSGSGTMGVLICTIGSLCFLLGCIDKMFFTHDIDIVTQSIIFVGIGASMLAHRKSQEKYTNIDQSILPGTNTDLTNDKSSDEPLNS